MTRRVLALLLAVTMLMGMVLPASAQETQAEAASETESTEAAEPAQTTEASTEPVQSVSAEVTSGSFGPKMEGGSTVSLADELFPTAVKAAAGESLTYTFTDADITAADGDMLLLSFAVRCESACSELVITVDFSGTDMTMKYYVPIQWSRIYMPVSCSGSLTGVKLTVNTGAVLVGEATVENKGDATIEDLKLQSGMWMLDEFEDIALDAEEGVRSQNQDVYDSLGVTTSNCIDLVISSCGNYIYSIGGGYLTVTDVSDPANPKIRSIYNNPDYPTDYGDTRQICLLPGAGANGDAVIFNSRISGTFIVDVSDPDNPVECSHYDALEMATGLAVYENYAFVCNRQYGVEVVDVSDLYNPTHLGTVARGGEIQSCKVVDGILYAGAYDISAVEMYDLTDLLNPKYLGAAKLNGKGDGMTVATVDGKTYLYAGTGHHSTPGMVQGKLTDLNYGQGNGLEIFDVTDPTNPILLSVSKIDGRFCHSQCDYWGAEVSIHDGRVYVYLLSTYNGAYVYDATDPAAPVRLAHVAIGVDQDSSYFDSLGHTSSVYPVIFQYDPTVYKQAPVGALTVYEGALYMAGAYTDLHICQADWAHPIAEDPDPVPVSPDTAYYDDSLAVTQPGGQTYAVANQGEYLYVASGEQGILIYTKDLKTLVKTIPVTDICYDVYIQDGLLYCAEGRNGLVVYSISDDGLTLTQQKHYISDWDLVTTVRPSPTGKFAALHVGSTRGEIVDLSGETPKRVVRCSTSTQAYHHNVELSANGRYVVFWGLSGNEQWYDFGANDANTTPKQLSISPFKSRAAMTGGYTGYKGNVILQTRSHGYIYYDPSTATADEVLNMTTIRPVTAFGSTTKTSIYGRGYVYENLLISCDRVYGRMYITDISDIDNPVLLKSWTGVKGNPDIATVVDKTLYIPLGYEGIMMLDLTEYLEPHLHCACAGTAENMGEHTACTDVKWTPISEALESIGLTAQTADFGKLPTGNYYLDVDVNVTGTSAIGTMPNSTATAPSVTKDINICLNGHNITTSTDRVFGNTRMGSTLSITDCSGIQDADGNWTFSGTVYGGTSTYGQIIYTNAGSVFNIYGGNFTSNNTATAGGLIAGACESCGDQDGDGDYDADDRSACATPSVFNLYNGKLYGGKAKDGGNVVLFHTAKMNIYGGILTGGTATTGTAGNILSYSKGTITIYGGEVSNGTAATTGGNIQTGGGTLVLEGGLVTGGKSGTYAGNIYVSSGGMTMNGGTVSDGVATSYCGNIYNTGTFKLYGGTISGGTAGTYAGSVQSTKTFYMYGGTITGGNAKGGAGGNLMVGTGSQFNIYGGTIENGTSSQYGGNIQVLGTAYLCGGTVQDGTAPNGGNIAVYNKGKLYTLKSSSTREDLFVQYGTASGLGSNIYVGYSSATPPTLNIKWGTFRYGSVYAGPNSSVTVSECPVISQLAIGSGYSVTFGTLTEGARIHVTMADRVGTFGTGTEAALAYLTADYTITHADGSLALVAPDSFQLLYDDRKNLSGLIGADASEVTITDQTVTSKQIGTETADAAVLTYDAATDTLYAVGTGTATLNVNGKAYPVTVSAAPISLLMITGHSIGEGYLADGTQSVVCEAGQVYGSFGREALTSAEGGLGYGASVRAGGEGELSLDVYAPGNGGTESPSSALGYQWNKLTGEKVWVLNTAVAGACINEWQPDASNHSGRYTDYYNTAVAMYSYAQQILSKEIAAGHYSLSHMAMFYFSSGNFKWYTDWTQEKLEQDYETFWEGMKKDLAYDVDGDGDGETETVESLGLVPAWNDGDLSTYNYDKAANFYMAASENYPDVYLALNYQSWTQGLDTFPEVDYEIQNGETARMPESVYHTSRGGTSDNSIFCANDKTHHSQIGYNGIGIEIANSLNAWYTDATITSGKLQSVDTQDIPETLMFDLGETMSLVPVIEPVYAGGMEVTLTGALEMTYPMSITATGYEGGTVTISANGVVLDTVTISVRPEHKHCVCGGAAVGLGDHTECADVVWTPISTALENVGLTTETADFGKLPSGNYYLDVDVVVTGMSSIGAKANTTTTEPSVVKNISICLNGHNITTTANRVFGYVYMDSSLSISDCSGKQDTDGSWTFGGTVYGGTGTYGQIVYIYAGSELNIYGGNFTSNNTATTAGLLAIACDQGGDQDGDGDYDDSDKNNSKAPSVFNLYNGKLYGGKAANGGNVTLYHNANMNMYGGIITGGTATTGAGGNILSYSRGTITVGGGEISGGTAATYGGNIQSGSSALILNGGTVSDGTAGTYAGNIYSSGEFKMYGGTISGGTAATYAGSVQITKTFYMYGGTITGGQAKKGSGGNLMVGTGSQFNIYGGTIENGTSTEYGGNIQVLGTAYLCGGTVRGGTAANGGNIAVYNKGKLYTLKSSATREDLLVTGGTASGLGTNIYVGYSSATPPTLDIQWGTFENGTVYAGPNAKVTISECPVISEIRIKDGISCTFGTLTEGAAIGITMEDPADVIGTGTADAVQYLSSTDQAYAVTHKDGSLYLAAPVAQTDGKTYATVSEAIAFTTGCVQLTANVTEDVVITGDLYLDLAGFTLSGSVTGTGKLYLLDSATDDFAGDYGTIVGTVEASVETFTELNGKTYLVVNQDGVYSAHCYEVKLTHVSMDPNNDALGYKAQFNGDEIVCSYVTGFGFNLWVSEDNVKTYTKDGAFTNGQTLTLRLKNIMAANGGEMTVNGNAFVTFSLSEDAVTSADHSTTMKQVLQTVDENFDSYTEAQKNAVKAFCTKFETAMSEWALSNILP